MRALLFALAVSVAGSAGAHPWRKGSDIEPRHVHDDTPSVHTKIIGKRYWLFGPVMIRREIWPTRSHYETGAGFRYYLGSTRYYEKEMKQLCREQGVANWRNAPEIVDAGCVEPPGAILLECLRYEQKIACPTP